MKPQGEAYWSGRPTNDPKHDWVVSGRDWLDGYRLSMRHPHRKLIIRSLESMGFDSLLEIGCNVGPNLALIKKHFPRAKLAGIDLNSEAIKRATTIVPGSLFGVASILDMPIPNGAYDVVLTDAVLMYVSPRKIRKAISEIYRVVNKGVIIVDWFDESLLGVVKDFHWARNYPKLLKEYGFTLVEEKRITNKEWPTEKWKNNGRQFTFLRA